MLTRAESDGTRNVSPVYKPVLQTFTTHPGALYHVTLQTDDGETETLSTTAGHPFYVAGQQAFVYAEKLVAGDRLVLPEGRGAAVTAIRIEEAPAGETFTTYNFAVAETHTYFVGRQGVWVHNDGAPCDFLAMVYKSELDKLGATKESAFAKMVAAADNLLADGTFATRAGRDQHLRDAAKKLGLPADTPIPGITPRVIDPTTLQIISNAAKGFEILECDKCVRAIKKAMKRNGLSGEVLDLRANGNRPFIFSDRLGKAISRNGFHQAVRVGDTIFDNVNPNGILYTEWLEDLNAVYGYSIKATPF